MEVRKLGTRPCHRIEMGCRIALGPKRPDVRVAHIIDEDDDHVGRRGFRDRNAEHQDDEQTVEKFHGTTCFRWLWVFAWVGFPPAARDDHRAGSRVAMDRLIGAFRPTTILPSPLIFPRNEDRRPNSIDLG